jgi:hypothetical protein
VSDELAVSSGETETVNSGVTERADVADVDGTLRVQGTLRVIRTQVLIDGQGFDATDLQISPSSLEVSLNVSDDEIDTLRQFDRTGDFSVISQFGGGFRVEGDGGAQTLTLDPPTAWKPPVPQTEAFIQSYNEQQISPVRFEVSLSLQLPENRTPQFGTVNNSGGVLEISTFRGDISLSASEISQIAQSGSTVGGTIDLSIRVTTEEAAALADSLGFPDGIVQREVSDGQDLIQDTSPDNRQTVDITADPDAKIDSETFAVTNWTLSRVRRGEPKWLFDLQLIET